MGWNLFRIAKQPSILISEYWPRLVPMLITGFTSAIALIFYCSHLTNPMTNISFMAFALSFISTLISPFAGLGVLTLLQGTLPGLTAQLSNIGIQLGSFNHPGLDAALGFMLGYCLRSPLAIHRNQRHSSQIWLTCAWIWIVGASCIAIARNIWQSASVLSVKGLLFNISIFRELGWHFDYYPLNDLFAYSLAFFIVFTILQLASINFKRTQSTLVLGLFAASLVNFIVCFVQYLNKATGALTLSGLWPDIHAFSGFAALCFFIGLWWAFKRDQQRNMVAVGIALMATGLVCLIWSASRSTLLLSILILLAIFLSKLFKTQGRQRIFVYLSLIAMAGILAAVLGVGIRGVDFATFLDLFQNYSFEKFNTVFSLRPEMFLAALGMFAEFPLSGLGQGAFYRLSSMSPFSSSRVFVGYGGENAHSYILQTLCELGIVGFTLMAIVCLLSCKRDQNGHWNLASIAWLALLTSNVYAHSLLVREMLILSAGFVGLGLASKGESIADMIRQRFPSRIYASRMLLSCTALFLLFALHEIQGSFRRYPFTYGQNCFTAQAAGEDGWSKGIVQLKKPAHSRGVQVTFHPGHPDIGRRSLNINLVLEGENGKILDNKSEAFSQEAESTLSWEWADSHLIDLDGVLKLKTSRCFVPVNLGISRDNRTLGLIVRKADFYP